MPKSSQSVFRITAAFVEFIHDETVAKHWPCDQPVSSEEYRDKSLIESAVNRPFQSFGGVEFYPTLFQKAAPLFHSLVCNHPFRNGNKRTAVIAVDSFLVANGVFLALGNEQVYNLAKQTATHNENGVPYERLIKTISSLLQKFSLSIIELANEEDMKDVYRYAQSSRISIRNHPTNST